MKNLVVIFIIAVVPAFAWAESNAPIKQIAAFQVEGVGTVSVAHQDIGEPIGAPEEVRVSIICLKSKLKKEIGLFRLCEYGGNSYEKATMVLTLTLISGRVIHNSGEVVCDQVDHKRIELRSACS